MHRLLSGSGSEKFLKADEKPDLEITFYDGARQK